MSASKDSRMGSVTALTPAGQDILRRCRALAEAILEAARQGGEEPLALAVPLHGRR